MNAKMPEVEQHMQHLKEVCSETGIKLTHQRLEIFRELAQSGDHPDADTVWQRVRKRIPTVSLDTVYRTLWVLNDVGLITTLGSSRERARFDANLTRHHHFICSECGLTRDFYSNEFDELKLPRSLKTIGQVETTHVEVRGVCNDCKGK